MGDVSREPGRGVPQGGEDEELEISDEAFNTILNEAVRNSYLPTLDASIFSDLDIPEESADPQEPPQPVHPPPRAPEHPHSQGKFGKRCLISKVDETAVARVDGLVPEIGEAVPACEGVPKATFDCVGAAEWEAGVSFSARNINHTALDRDKGVPMWTNIMGASQTPGVPTSATSYSACSEGSLLDTGVPTSATSYSACSEGSLLDTGVPTSATSYPAHIFTPRKDSSVPINARIKTEVPAVSSANPSPQLQGARTGSQAINYIPPSVVSELGGQTNTVPANGQRLYYKMGDTLLPISVNYCVIQPGTVSGTTGVPPNTTAGTLLMLNQPSTSRMDFQRHTRKKIKKEKGGGNAEDETEEEEEEEKCNTGEKRKIGKGQEKRNKRKRQTKKQTEEEEEEEEEEGGRVRRYMEEPSSDPEKERKRKDALRAKRVREGKKERMNKLERENEELKKKEEKHKEEIDQLRKENDGLREELQGHRTRETQLLTTLKERLKILVVPYSTPGLSETAPGN